MNLSKYSKIIFLVESDENKYSWFSQLLKNKKYKLVQTIDVSVAIKKVSKLLPDLIICNYEQNGCDGFETFKLLQKSILNNRIPFIVIFPDKSLENIQLGLELGIDNFIFPPYDETKILEKITTTINKVDEYKALKVKHFEKIFGKSPLGVFITRGNELEKANSAFYKFFSLSEKSPLPKFNEIFDFENNTYLRRKIERCLKGKASDCFFANIAVKHRNDVKVDLQILQLYKYATERTLVQIIVKNYNRSVNVGTSGNRFVQIHHSGKEEEFGVTTREIEILKFSSKGFSIKQIAKELGISDRTVEKHRSNIMKKTDTANIIEALSKIYAEEFSERK
ncbi:LuxR C-terminal-related transcriptional regulator [Prolixibacteraceae bacterium Z1-6]|uniref:LuxR C-terminal-related transcriptional regulator n=1 Tax=Draconibacterium aestuarii TaxID=2998507 RepID=A0A9X3J6G6_9BACT|nr:LuxR C-terminal-related transcriptional regulator [Prolixibacteraceae bacterium Z1-6]